MASSNIAIARLIHIEGGLTELDDGAGLTKYGITQRSYPDLDIRNLSKEKAADIYKNEWWSKINGNAINSQEIANHLLDHAVNSGVAPAVKVLQKMLGLPKDGVVGKYTITALNIHSQDALFISNYKLERIKWYKYLAKKKTNRKFLYLWISRVFTEM